ncbi:MAG TPA: hypothetical protein VFH30_08620 [Acidimicrobiales bacterium]|nr:hypothetical protein [Acidimicrobiales bacterium]
MDARAVAAARQQYGALRQCVRGPRLRTGLVFAVSAALLAAVRAWQIAGRGAVWWNDSADFLASAGTGLFSLERWAGPRTAAAPLVLSLAGFEPRTYVSWQAAIAVVCWGALATSVWTVIEGRRARWLGALAVVAFSCTMPVTMWERSVLSESLGASTLALTVAAALQLARGVTGRRVAAVLAASALWLVTRDSHATVVLVAAVALGVGLVAAEWRSRGRREGDDAKERDRAVGALILLASWLFTFGAVAWVAASHGNRHVYPLRNVFEARVLPYPDRVSWFADHGMPQAQRFVGPDALAPVVGGGGQAPVTYVADDDPSMRQWLAWVARDGRGALAAWMATHPAYLVIEPLRNPERTFNNAMGDRSSYAPLDQREVPLVTDVLTPSRWAVLAVVAAVAAWATWRRRWGSPLLLVGAGTVALAAPHGLVSWHSDGMETARHLMVPALQLYLGALLMVLGAFGQRSARDVASEP